MNSIEQKIIDLVAEHREIDVTPTLTTNFRDDLNVDSLVIAEIAIEIEDAFELEPFGGEAFARLRTVADVVDLVSSAIES